MKPARIARQRTRRLPTVLRAPALAALLIAFALPAAANNFTVDTGTDGPQQPGNTTTCAEVVSPSNNTLTGKCSLRAAISAGNAIAGAHTIAFSPAVTTVTLVNGALTQLQAPFTITGTVPTRTSIDGNGQGCFDLNDSGTAALNHQNGATGSTISYLTIGNCSGAGIAANGHGYTFQYNYIGVNPAGTAAWKNSGDGIALSASAAYANQFIDTNALQALNNALPVQPVTASDISSFSVNLATTLQNLQPNTISFNVISGNALNGIEIFSQNLAGTIISNNMIGTDLTSAIAIPNSQNGVHLTGSTFANLIGPNNVISGNAQNGIQVDAGAVYLPNFIMGNRIGLSNLAGIHVGNALSGVVVDSKPDSSVGHFNPTRTALILGPLNLIADNQGANNNAFPDQMGADSAGIVITGSSTGVKVLGNTVGIAEFPAGTPTASKAYGNLGDGIIVTTSGNQIGGSGATDGNIIAANARHGLVLRGSSTTSNSLLGNSIGVHPGLAGNLALGNGVDGIHIDAASSVAIGGTGATDFNTIAANGRNGLKILNGGTANGWGNLSQRNLVFHNATASAGVGIDLDFAQNAANPLHAEIPANYTNLDQSQPVICIGPGDSGACAGSAAPSSAGGVTTLRWTMATHGPANFRMEFFSIDNADPNAAAHMTFLGEQLVTTDASGALNSAACSQGRCTATLSASTSGRYVLATATDITPLTDVPGGGSDWKATLKCFIGNFGDPTGILSVCTANNTSEFSNTVNVPVAPPSITTSAATAITATSATFNGMVDDNGATTTVTFDYGLDTSYGTNIVATPVSIAAGTGNTAVSATPAAALTCGTTYHFRVDANNGVGGLIHGNDMSFTTLACPALPPTATTLAATNIGATTATLNGLVSSNGAQTGVDFRWGKTTSYGSSGNSTPSQLPPNASNAAVTENIFGLACGTTYHFIIDANNGVGGAAVSGSDLTFTTLACSAPGATTQAASNVTTNSITFNGSISPNGSDTAVFFDYGATAAYGSVVAGTPSTVLASVANQAALATVSGQCGAIVHFRVRATNTNGTTNGGDMTATMGACGATPPTLSTSAATNITTTAATLNGTGNANNYTTNVNFEYGTTQSYGQTAPAILSPLSGTTDTAVSANLSGLSCGTTYHFRLDGNNSGGSVSTADNTFTTQPCAGQVPTATSLAATAIAATSATLNGTINANGSTTSVSFSYGPTAAYGNTVAASPASLAANAVGAPVSAAIAALTCGTTYHFRVDATNGNGAGHGGDMSFTTAACPVVTTFSGPTATGTGNATAVLAGGGPTCTLVNPAFVAAPASQPAGVSFPDGLFQFTASGCTGSITLTVTFPTAFAAGTQYWKYGPTPNQASDHWYTLGAGNSLSLAANVATFTIADGGLGDDDLAVNGTIVDQGGPGVPAVVAPQATVAAPTLDPRSLALLCALLAALGTVALRAHGKPLRP